MSGPETSAPETRPQRAKAHHYVPQVYLRAWAEGTGRVAVRRRDSPTPFVAATKRVAQETDLYTLDTPQGPSDWLERRLADFEGLLPTMVEHLSTGRVPRRSSPDREVYAALLALQYVRTPDRLEIMHFPQAAAAFAGRVSVLLEDMARLLRERNGSEPTTNEVKGACDYVNYSLRQGFMTRNQALDMVLGTLPEVGKALVQRCWSVEVANEGTFVTSDQPLSLWVRRPPAFGGVGLAHANQVRFPLGPRHLLVLHAKHPETCLRVDRDRVASVNQRVAATSRSMIIGRPQDEELLTSLPLRERRPTLRFNEGPVTIADHLGHESRSDDRVLHLYRPYDDLRPD